MIHEFITIDDAIALLNEANRLDPNAVALLVATRFGCNAELADHPTIQVAANSEFEGETTVEQIQVGETGTEPPFRVGLLGIMNGLFGVYEDGRGAITAEVDDDTQMVACFRRTRAIQLQASAPMPIKL